MKRWLVAALTALAWQSAAQAPVPDAAQVERRVASVETLIERSSAARQVEASAVPAALERRESARTTFRRAKEAYARGDLASAAALLPQASTLMFEAVKLAAPEQVAGPKQRSDIEARLESARALAAAQKRIAAEKAVPGSAETTRAIERALAEGTAALEAGELGRASASVEQGYLVAKAAIGAMRSGDTLVRSLNFASRQEEFAYELDRNDTHRMLLSLLVDPSKSQGSQPGFERAASLRTQAEGAARAGDHGAGIRMLEESTRELVRAIRAAGIYIPG